MCESTTNILPVHFIDYLMFVVLPFILDVRLHISVNV